MSEIRRRVTGTEMEWAIGLRRLGDTGYEQAGTEEIDQMVKILQKEVGSIGQMLQNGGKCYRDENCLEYATGEDDSFMGTVANEIAGEQLVDESLEHYMAESNNFEGYSLLKRVQFNSWTTTGYHINLCADATKVALSPKSLYKLGLLAATESMFTGAGTLYQSGPVSEAQTAIAQKATGLKRDFSSYVIEKHKPLISLRPEPHADKDRFTRIQIIGLDPNISPWASWMALGTASLCLRAIEQNRSGKSIYLHTENEKDHPLARLAAKVALDPNLDTKVELSDGKTMSAFDIQWELLAQAQTTDHTDEEAQVLYEWNRALTDLQKNPRLMIDRTGWIVRHEKIAQYARKHNLPMNHPDVIARDKKWDGVNAKSFANSLLRNKLWSQYMPEASLIAERKTNPCPNTRAVLRSNAIKKGQQYNERVVDWSEYRLGPSDSPTIHLGDPLMTSL